MGSSANCILDKLVLFNSAVHCFIVLSDCTGGTIYAYGNAGCSGSGLYRNSTCKGNQSGESLMKHAVKNSIIPVVTVLGPIVVNLLTGSLAVENIFSIPGIGSLFVDCIKANDYPVIMGYHYFFMRHFI